MSNPPNHPSKFTFQFNPHPMAFLSMIILAIVSLSLICPSFSQFAAWPKANGSETVSTTKEYKGGSINMYNRRFTAGTALGKGDQEEGQKAIFKLSNGAKLSNVIIGAPGADGIHCFGSCTLENVWWEDVGEDAATFRSTSGCTAGNFLVIGGGAKSASDKVFMINGGGTLTIKNFQVSNYGKLVRSCGECGTQCQRNIVVDTVKSSGQTSTLVGINENYGDKATIKNVQGLGSGANVCTEFMGVTSGTTSKLRDYKVGSAGDGKNCIISNIYG